MTMVVFINIYMYACLNPLDIRSPIFLKIDKISYVTAKFGKCRPINN